jgi:hypothetical protein
MAAWPQAVKPGSVLRDGGRRNRDFVSGYSTPNRIRHCSALAVEEVFCSSRVHLPAGVGTLCSAESLVHT